MSKNKESVSSQPLTLREVEVALREKAIERAYKEFEGTAFYMEMQDIQRQIGPLTSKGNRSRTRPIMY